MSSTYGEGWHVNMNGIPFIAAGHGIRSTSYLKRSLYQLEENRVSEDELPDVKRKYLQWKDYFSKYVAQLPSHYEFLRDEIYKSA